MRVRRRHLVLAVAVLALLAGGLTLLLMDAQLRPVFDQVNRWSAPGLG